MLRVSLTADIGKIKLGFPDVFTEVARFMPIGAQARLLQVWLNSVRVRVGPGVHLLAGRPRRWHGLH